jgi:hypothetical protein
MYKESLCHCGDGWRIIDPLDLEFKRRPVRRLSSRGTPYITWVPTGMPRIPKTYLNSIVYLYGTVEAAERGDNTGGTGFFVHVHFKCDSNQGFRYVITNKHVARTGASIIRINCNDGKPDIFDIGPDQWTIHPGGDDLALYHLPLADKHVFNSVSERLFATEQEFKNGDYGVGDPAFMIGRFIAHDGKDTNIPAVGFGNLSIPPSAMKAESGFPQLSFGVEMRSMQGSSGSPVFTYTDGWNMETGVHSIGSNKLRFLGVNWGQVVFPTEIKEHIIKIDQHALRPGEREARFVSLNTGMNGVVPAWKLLELLYLPSLVKAREEYEREWLVKNVSNPTIQSNGV